MARALHFPDGNVHPAFGKLSTDLAGDAVRGYELVVASRLWGQRGVPFREDFKGGLNTHYGAGLGEVDFRGATEEARAQINAWVEERTKGRIKDLFQPGVLNNSTTRILAVPRGLWLSNLGRPPRPP